MLVDQFHRGEHHIGVGGLEPIVANDLSQEAIALLDVSVVVLAVVGMDLPGIVGPGT
jgi:hypothetical protein